MSMPEPSVHKKTQQWRPGFPAARVQPKWPPPTDTEHHPRVTVNDAGGSDPQKAILYQVNRALRGELTEGVTQRGWH